jgi:hypothetical protein
MTLQLAQNGGTKFEFAEKGGGMDVLQRNYSCQGGLTRVGVFWFRQPALLLYTLCTK